MVRIESPLVELNSSSQVVSRDFRDWKEFESMLREGPVSDFSAEGEACTFKVAGGVTIHLKRSFDPALIEGNVVSLVTQAPTPVKFSMDIVVTSKDAGCTCQVVCDADLNPFTRMMVEPALNRLFEKIAEQLNKRY